MRKRKPLCAEGNDAWKKLLADTETSVVEVVIIYAARTVAPSFAGLAYLVREYFVPCGIRFIDVEANFDTFKDDIESYLKKKNSDFRYTVKHNFATEKEKLSAEIDSIRAELNKLHEKESKLRKTRNQRKPELDSLMENVRLFENETHLTCTIADTFLEKVIVYDKWCIEITWKCEDLVEKALSEASEVEEVMNEVGGEKMVG